MNTVHIDENDFHQGNRASEVCALYLKKNFTGKKAGGTLFIDTRKRFLTCFLKRKGDNYEATAN